MAKLPLLAFMALCCTFASVLLVNAMEISVEGRVYCDTCRAGFVTNVTEYIPGAKVRLECIHYKGGDSQVENQVDSDEIEFTIDGVTDNTGKYYFKAQDGHEKDTCYVVLVESPRPDCKEIIPGRDRARFLLSSDAGMPGNKRFPNDLGYLKDKPLDICGSIMKQYNTEEDY
ncbi:pollen-specific protein C13-like protein [Carex littledalei]|uniref:Pollen-specific protein C13-like protein n=1 Tax=Carex littledalei TaxID=544730 RepID=A0A833Q9I4_9POAL|nr:pollen-specific protein C13-like protein [Carex littledalei]